MARKKIIKRTIDKLNRVKKPPASTGAGEAALYGKGFVNVEPLIASSRLPIKPTMKMLIAGGETAYNSFVREAGYAKDARVPEYAKLKAFQHARWEKIAADVYAAMGAIK